MSFWKKETTMLRAEESREKKVPKRTCQIHALFAKDSCIFPPVYLFPQPGKASQGHTRGALAAWPFPTADNYLGLTLWQRRTTASTLHGPTSFVLRQLSQSHRAEAKQLKLPAAERRLQLLHKLEVHNELHIQYFVTRIRRPCSKASATSSSATWTCWTADHEAMH